MDKEFSRRRFRLNGYSPPQAIVALVWLKDENPRYADWLAKCYGKEMVDFLKRRPEILDALLVHFDEDMNPCGL